MKAIGKKKMEFLDYFFIDLLVVHLQLRSLVIPLTDEKIGCGSSLIIAIK